MNCRLCNHDKKLEQSHIIPKFVFKWIKKTSLTKKLRNNIVPNCRREDGDNLPFLCSECEDLFNKYETYFANSLFYPATKNTLLHITFTDELLKFIVSIIWRSLKYRLEKEIMINELTETEIKRFNEFLDNCKEYFHHNDISFLKNYSFYIIPLTEIIETLNIIPPFTFTYQRVIDASFRAFSQENPHEGYDYLCFYVKIPFFLFVVEIIKNENYVWDNTDVKNQGYIWDLRNLTINNLVIEILNTMRENKAIAATKLSDSQLKKIQESVSNAIDKGLNAEQIKTIEAKKREHDYEKNRIK
ncbi:hypothetical protein [Anaerospora hongkongensis]|uniref:hypothetical protein n=1 Tax=Anaerospora hongkongensis TaxID=244830 RepID=UPI0028977391|nr:hypothetical protein [Anaerospora hongkongensis]